MPAAKSWRLSARSVEILATAPPRGQAALIESLLEAHAEGRVVAREQLPGAVAEEAREYIADALALARVSR